MGIVFPSTWMYDSQPRVENQGFNGNTQRNRCLFWHCEGNQAMKIRNDKGNRSDLNWPLFLLFGFLFCWMSHLLWWRPGCRTHWHQILSSVLKASSFRLQMMLPSFNMFPCPLVNLSPHLSGFFPHVFIYSFMHSILRWTPLRSSHPRCENGCIQRKNTWSNYNT